MSACTETDRPSCAVGLFISWTYLNMPLSVPRGEPDEASVWNGRGRPRRGETKDRVRDGVCTKKFLKKNPPRSDDVSWLEAAGGDLAAGKTNRVEGGKREAKGECTNQN